MIATDACLQTQDHSLRMPPATSIGNISKESMEQIAIFQWKMEQNWFCQTPQEVQEMTSPTEMETGWTNHLCILNPICNSGFTKRCPHFSRSHGGTWRESETAEVLDPRWERIVPGCASLLRSIRSTALSVTGRYWLYNQITRNLQPIFSVKDCTNWFGQYYINRSGLVKGVLEEPSLKCSGDNCGGDGIDMNV